jgi:hypothetical protein
MRLLQKPNRELIQNFEAFIELVPAKRLNQFLRKLMICYFLHEVAGGIEDGYEDGLKDISNLCEFLDTIDESFDQSELL